MVSIYPPEASVVRSGSDLDLTNPTVSAIYRLEERNRIATDFTKNTPTHTHKWMSWLADRVQFRPSAYPHERGQLWPNPRSSTNRLRVT